MSGQVTVSLKPLGKCLQAKVGTPLTELLPPYGIEFPCGGKGKCKACRVRVLDGSLDVQEAKSELLDERHDAQKQKQEWQLACQCRVSGPVTLEVAQWESVILADHGFVAGHPSWRFVPGAGFGVAVDLGTTTLVAQLLDLRTGKTLSVSTAINPQAAHGSDVMSRVEFALTEEGRQRLGGLIREKLAQMIGSLIASAAIDPCDLDRVVLCGNTVMHHLFCNVDPKPLSHFPFNPLEGGPFWFKPKDLLWDLPDSVDVHFLPCIGSFVGSDVLAGIIATGIAESDSLYGLIDLGTNGEIAVGNRRRILCASTAAGPAFEAGRISMGMRASPGAISQVTKRGNGFACRVLGGTRPRGICGSGLVDAVAVGLETGAILQNGRLAHGADNIPLAGTVKLTQRDVRELQLAKGAVAAGLRILMQRLGTDPDRLGGIYLAGAFGNYIDAGSARRIGLFAFAEDMVKPVGNAALLGTKMLLLQPHARQVPMEDRVLAAIEHVPLAADAHFQDIFVEEMAFSRDNRQDKGQL